MNSQAKFFCAGFNSMNSIIRAGRVVNKAFDVVAEKVVDSAFTAGEHTKCFARGVKTAWVCRELQITKLDVISHG